jgi:dUTP pyrophosphatase
MLYSINIAIKLLDQDMPVPAYAHDGDAGCDLMSAKDLVLKPGERAMVPTGIAIAIPEGFAGFVQPRSGLAAKHGIGIVNGPGLIDSGYRGEIRVILVNHDPRAAFYIKKGDKIAQLVIQEVTKASFNQVQDLEDTKRGSGGFGSTGA